MIVTSYPSSCRLVSVLAAMLVALAIYYSTITPPPPDISCPVPPAIDGCDMIDGMPAVVSVKKIGNAFYKQCVVAIPNGSGDELFMYYNYTKTTPILIPEGYNFPCEGLYDVYLNYDEYPFCLNTKSINDTFSPYTSVAVKLDCPVKDPRIIRCCNNPAILNGQNCTNQEKPTLVQNIQVRNSLGLPVYDIIYSYRDVTNVQIALPNIKLENNFGNYYNVELTVPCKNRQSIYFIVDQGVGYCAKFVSVSNNQISFIVDGDSYCRN